MTRNPTQIVTEHMAGDATLRRVASRLTLVAEPLTLPERVAAAVCRSPGRAYPAARNARLVRADAHCGALRRALVQWASQYAPSDVRGYAPLLAWSLARVDWPEVVQRVPMETESGPVRAIGAPRRVGARRMAAPAA